jgi:NADH dehydrogenase/NADH:ubiquinone oxidoreductase subunit G
MKVKDPDRIVPSCATRAEDGLRVESETEEIRVLRRTALELLLSDHDGDAGSCECGKRDICRLRKYAALYGADATRFCGARRKIEPRQDHAELVYHSGRCILCGICIQLAQQAGEPLGLTLIGRGFDLRVDTPLGASWAQALQRAAWRCVAACPTGALCLRAPDSPPAAPAPPDVGKP